MSILEAFKISSIESNYIKEHLKKLSENYDPNGLKINYAVIYAHSTRFSEFWDNYKEFVPTIEFNNTIVDGKVEDVSNRYPEFAGIRVGLTEHRNNDVVVKLFHIFMNMML